MKKILLTSIASIAVAGFCGSAFGQGQVLFENVDGSSFVTLNSASGPKSGSGLVVELLWNNGTSFVLEDTFTSTYTGNGSGGQGPGLFGAGEVTIPNSGTQSFEVEGFYTTGGIAYSGTTASFTAKVNVSPTPPVSLDTSGNWAGNLVLHETPEPGTIALGGLGAAALLLFRRRNK